MEVSVAEVEHQSDRIFGVDDQHRLLAKRLPRRILVGISVVVAIALRVYIAINPFGNLNADEAVAGLMARHILEGEFPVFFWAQNYGGTAEVFLTAALFRLIDSSTAALKLVTLALFVAAAFITWRIGKRLFGEPGASFAALLLLVWPPYLVWKSMQAHGYYGVLLLVGTAALLVTFQIADRPTWRRFGVLGLLLGAGWWTSPQIALIAIPILLWLAAYRNTRRWWGLAWLCIGSAIGSAPWWMWNMVNGWSSITDRLEQPSTTYWERLSGLFRDVLPLGLGLRLPNSDRWVLPAWGGWVFYGIILATFLWLTVWVIRNRHRALILLVGIALTLPWIYALSPHTWYLAEPRYLTLLFPPLCLILGWSFNRSFVVTVFGLMLTLPVTLVGLRSMNTPLFEAVYSEHPQANELSSVIAVLREYDVRYVIADYWIAYPISFESREEIIATSSGHVRYAPHDELVRSQPAPAFVFYTGAADQQAFEIDRATSHPDYVPVLRNGFTVYVDRSSVQR